MKSFFSQHDKHARRHFLSHMALLAGVSTVSLGRALAALEGDFVWARLKTDTGDWYTDMKGQGMAASSDLNLIQKVTENTNLTAPYQETVIEARKEDLEKYPLLYLTGHENFTLPVGGPEALKAVLLRGAFLFLDDCSGTLGRGFDQSARALAAGLFPDQSLQPLPMSHPVYHCFFNLDEVLGGDKRIVSYMEGVTVKDRTPLVLCSNDLGCAWEGHPCTPDGEKQRDHAFQLGLKIIFYALTF
ncbi:DUF4159 domain-containing protein [bacterium]|nr:DUF4159 domain-containing protein [bacterium]